jgi:PAS domain S-box-containing protein
VKFRLYFAGNGPHSTRALEQVSAWSKAHPSFQISLETIDVQREPSRAVADDIVLVPSLVQLEPGPLHSFTGLTAIGARLAGDASATFSQTAPKLSGEIDAMVDSSGQVHPFTRTAPEAAAPTAKTLDQAVLSILPAHICVLDARGVIVSVNDTWRSFGKVNSWRAGEDRVGQNYLEACETVEGDCSWNALQVAAGIRAVLRGEQNEYSLDYASDGPAQQKWFRVHVDSLRTVGLEGVVVMHVDVTDRRAVPEEKRSEALLRIAGHTARLGGWSVDYPEVRLTWSDEVCDIHDVPRGTTPTAREANQFYAPESRDVIDLAFAKCASAGTPFDLELEIITAKGRRLWVRSIGQAERDVHGQIIRVHGALQDITEKKRAEEALRVSEERFSSAFDYAPIGMAITDLEGHWLKTNRALCRLTGYTEEEFSRMSYQDITHPDDIARDLDLADQLISGEIITSDIEKRYLHKDGHVVPIAVSCSLVRDSRGEPLYFIVQIQDATERNRAQESLKLFRRLIDQSNDGIEVIDPVTGNFLDVNERTCLRLGYTRREMLAMNLKDIEVRPESLFALPLVIEEARRSGFRVVEGLHRRKNGTTFPVEANVQYIQMEREYLVAVVRDITERKNTEDRIAEQAALLEKAQDAIFVRDLQHRVTFWNASSERLYGWRVSEVIGRRVTDLIYDDLQLFQRAMEQVLETGEWTGELEQVSKDGKPLLVESRWNLVRDEKGEPKSILTLNTDISEKKKLEAQFLRTQRMESIGTLAGGIAHDLNNVLAPILMAVELLSEKITDDQSRSLLATLKASSEHGADLVKQVLSFARGLEGQRVLVSPGHLIREIQKIVRDTFPKNINFAFNFSPDLWTVTGDPTQLHQVFMNLCVNARDAMPNGGDLTIDMQNLVLDSVYADMNPEAKSGAYVLVKVTDTGLGMPRDIRDKIFEPFFTTKEIGKGTGLGLSTTLAIVKSHGGFINVYSEPGRGASFTIYLPANHEEEPTVSAPAGELPLLSRGHGELILVAEDEESIRSVTKKTLEKFGYRVLLASHGAEAVSLYAQHRDEVAVVLTDMAMPVMDGVSTIIALRAINPEVEIIASSGLASQGGMGKAMGAGVRHFIHKPYTAETMLSILAQALKPS